VHAHTPVRAFPRLLPQPSNPGYTLSRWPVTAVSDPLHAFPRLRPQPACTQPTVTSMLPCQPVYMPTRLPTRDDVLTSALPRPPTASPDFAYDTMQRDCVDDRNVYTNSSEQWLAELPLPPPVHRQVPLLSDRTQTTASAYVNTDPIPSLSAHRYADTPFDSTNYQNISANLSLPSLSTHTNVPTHVNVPLSQAIALGQSNVTQPSALYAASYSSDLNSSSMVAFPPTVCTWDVDNSQRLPIVVEQPGFSAFSRTDVPYSRSTTVQYTVDTSVSTSTAPLQSPSVHWRKRLAYDYIQPDTGLGAPTHAAPAVHSGYIRPQTSDTHTHIQPVCTCKTCHLEKVIQ